MLVKSLYVQISGLNVFMVETCISDTTLCISLGSLVYKFNLKILQKGVHKFPVYLS